MFAPEWIKKTLEKEGMAFEEDRHPEAYTAQEVAEVEHVSGHRVAKVVVVMADNRPVELILPASRKVLLERVRALLGAREVRLATEAEIEEAFPDCEVGALPPLAHGTPMVMDDTMKVPGEIVFQAGTHRDAIRMNFNDWFWMVRPRVESFTMPAEPPPAGAFMSRDRI